MRGRLFAANGFFLAMALLPSSSTAAPPVLTNVAQVRALTYEQAGQGFTVDLHGVVTYYDQAQRNMFFQDSTGSIYVQPGREFPVTEGSRVEIWGRVEAGYTNEIVPTRIREISRGPLPEPTSLDYAQAALHANDCRFVTMEGIVRSSTLQWVEQAQVHLLELEVDGQMMQVTIINDARPNPVQLLDATVRVTGNLGGRFDGHDHILGLQIESSSANQMVVVSPAKTAIEQVPVTPLHDLVRSDRVVRPMERVRTEGVLTLYDRGERMVIQSGGDALLIQTEQMDPMTIGQQVEVTGFPTAINGAPALQLAQAFAVGKVTPLPASPITYADAMSDLYSNRVVSLDGELVSETRERDLDTLTLRSGPSIFQAVYRKRPGDPDPISVYEPGTKLRVEGVCIVHIRGFWGVVESLQVHMRSAGDITVLALPSWWTVGHMLYLTTASLAVLLLVFLWGVWMRRRLSEQETLLRHKVEAEAERLDTLARLERQRSHILELINSFEPLPRVFTEIHRYTAEMWPGVRAYSHVLEDRALNLLDGAGLSQTDAARLRNVDPVQSDEPCAVAVRTRSLFSRTEPRPVWSRPLISSHAEVLGALTFEAETTAPVGFNQAAFDFGCNLAAIAVDNRRLYEALLHRSEHDQLTGLPNRMLLDARLEKALRHAREVLGSVAILFLDLDDFKAVNDNHGHRIGDLFLCEVARRFQGCLRANDVLGRLGGDEFLAVIADVTNHALASEIAGRILRAMQQPFVVEEIVIRGSVSIGVAIYQEVGVTANELKHRADAAMYAAKRAGGNRISFS